jgi:hypothetical protein
MQDSDSYGDNSKEAEITKGELEKDIANSLWKGKSGM